MGDAFVGFPFLSQGHRVWVFAKLWFGCWAASCVRCGHSACQVVRQVASLVQLGICAWPGDILVMFSSVRASPAKCRCLCMHAQVVHQDTLHLHAGPHTLGFGL